VDWRVLGPFEVWANGSPISLGGRQRRLLLAILLANAEQTVSTDRLIEEVWGGSPPDSARKTVQAHVAHLRRALNSEAEVLSSSGEGYVVSPGDGNVDADRFVAAVSAAHKSRSNDPGASVGLLDGALAMFRGEPYAGLADDALAVKVEAARLAELRLTAREDRLDALLASGDTARVAADAERLLAEHPLRERLWAIQMLALYRSGRQSEALRSFSRARQILSEELGIEPSRELQVLEQQILEQDRSLSDSTAATTTPSSAVAVRRNPYKGLRAFDEADANDFYGRAELVRQLVDRLTARLPTPLTVVAGPSGAGKSSVLRAGLLPALRDAGLAVAVMFPGDDPTQALVAAKSEALLEIGQDAERESVDVVAVDQFEELFTLASAEEADSFIARITDSEDPTPWVATVRADFLEDLMAHPDLGRELQESLVLVPPLEDHEVEAAIVEPAQRVGVDVEPSLVATVVREVHTRASALPLMQYALTDLFERRRADVLTLDAFEREGGLSGALVRRADQVFKRLSLGGQNAARQVFLQLVTIADNDEYVRRRVHRQSLQTSEPQLTDEILERFGAQRLLTFDQDPASGDATVELAHESLLHVWPRLSNWVDEVKEELLMRSALNAALTEWEASGRDPSFLLAAGRLAQHESWTTETDLALTEAQIEFLEESRRAADLARARRRRRRNWIMAGFGIAAAVATAFGIVALRQAGEADAAASAALENEQRAVDSEQDAIDAAERAAESEAIAQEAARTAKADSLAAAANDQLEIDPELSTLLALQAIDVTLSVNGSVVDAAEEALHRAVLADRLIDSLSHGSEGIAHFSPDGQLFITSSENQATPQIWSVDPFELRLDLVGHTTRVIDAVFDPTGGRVATTSRDGSVRVWDATTGESEIVHNFGAGELPPLIPVFSNDGSKLAASRANTVWVWDLDTGDPLWSAQAPPPGLFFLNLEFSPDDSMLAVTQDTGSETADEIGPFIFDVASGEQTGSLQGHVSGAADVGFTPDGSRIVTAGFDGTVKVWDAETWEEVATFREHQGPVIDLQISADGTLVASGGEVDVKVWDIDTFEVEAEAFGHSGRVDAIDISRDGSLLLTSSTFDGTTRLWDLSPSGSHELIGLPGSTGPGALVYSPDGSELAAAQGSEFIKFWDPLNGRGIRSRWCSSGRYVVGCSHVDSAVWRGRPVVCHLWQLHRFLRAGWEKPRRRRGTQRPDLRSERGMGEGPEPLARGPGTPGGFLRFLPP
jgi:WD40 repeat protein/DNA-binding SARP family transcriptional activator